jgi:PIN domain nuclease of toxin-antitoxin system
VRLLLDTHCWLWAMCSPERINLKVRKILENPETELYLSAASVWEASIKQALGKLKVPEPLDKYFATRMREERVYELAISVRHAARVGELPHHQCESLPIVTADPAFKKYDVKSIWAL